MFRSEEKGPVAKYGLRRRPSEPENVGSNPTGPAFVSPILGETVKLDYVVLM